MRSHFSIAVLLAELFLLLFICGCASAMTSTPSNPVMPSAPTIDTYINNNNTETPFILQSTPGANLTPMVSHPTGPGNSVPVVPNLSFIKAKIIATGHNERGVVLTVEVLSSQKQSGFADFGSAVIGKQIETQVITDATKAFLVNQIIQGELTYTGDENGGGYSLRNISQP